MTDLPKGSQTWKLSAHLGYLFPELPLIERIAAARTAGFEAIEHPHPFAIDSRTMRNELQALGLTFSQLAAGTGSPEKGEKGLAALPGREADFRDGLLRSIDYATAVGCRLIHPMAGVPAPGIPREEIRTTYIRNLQSAVSETAAAGLFVLVEPISDAGVPGYFASTMDLVLDLADEAAPDKVGVLLDTFHARASGLDMTGFIQRNSRRIAHVHIADYPGRHEPGTGSFDFPVFLRELKKTGYCGAIGFEYIPTVATTGFTWLSDPIWRGCPSVAPSPAELQFNSGS